MNLRELLHEAHLVSKKEIRKEMGLDEKIPTKDGIPDLVGDILTKAKGKTAKKVDDGEFGIDEEDQPVTKDLDHALVGALVGGMLGTPMAYQKLLTNEMLYAVEHLLSQQDATLLGQMGPEGIKKMQELIQQDSAQKLNPYKKDEPAEVEVGVLPPAPKRRVLG